MRSLSMVIGSISIWICTVQRLTKHFCTPGLYGALTVQGKPLHALKDQRICVVGAGSAGMGVTQMIASGMQKHVSHRHVCLNQPVIAQRGSSAHVKAALGHEMQLRSIRDPDVSLINSLRDD